MGTSEGGSSIKRLQQVWERTRPQRAICRLESATNSLSGSATKKRQQEVGTTEKDQRKHPEGSPAGDRVSKVTKIFSKDRKALNAE